MTNFPSLPDGVELQSLQLSLVGLPGFDHFSTHLIDGPYQLVVVDLADAPSAAAQCVLDTFTGVRVPVTATGHGIVELADVYVLPKLPAEVLRWYRDDYSLSINEDRCEPLEQWPDQSSWAAHCAQLLCWNEGFPDSPGAPGTPHTDRVVALLDKVGVSTYLELAQAVLRTDSDLSRAQFLAALEAATA